MRISSRFYVITVPLLTGLCALGATLALSRLLVNRERAQVQQRTDAEARHVASQLRSTVLKSVDLLAQIGDWWLSQGRPTSREEWQTDAQLFLNTEAGLREVAWLDAAGKTVWSVRPGTFPDFRPVEPGREIAALVEQVRAGGKLMLSPVTAVDGQVRFYACVPIRRGRVTGFIAGAFDAPVLVESLLTEQGPGDYSLRITADGHSIVALGHAPSPLWYEGARGAKIAIANRWWSVQLTPAATDIDRLQRVVWGFGLVVAPLLSACTALALIYRREEAALRIEVEERRRAEQAVENLNRDLQHQVADFRTLMAVLPVGVAISNDPECRDIWVNPKLAAMLHMSVGENISRLAPEAERMPYKLLRGGKEVPAEELPMQHAARTGTSVLDMDLDILREDGTILNTLSYSAPVLDEHGRLRHIINVCVDITDRKRTEQERQAFEERLLRAEKDHSLGLMAAGMAHDFNNLLTAIIGNADVASRELPSHSDARRSIEEAISGANKAAELISQLIAYTGRGWLEFKPVDLSSEIHGMAERIKELTPPQVDVVFDLDADLPPVQAAAGEVEQVLRNLVSNAVEAIGERRGTIRVRTDHCSLGEDSLARDYPDQNLTAGQYVRLEVRDSGSGVPQEHAGRLFDPFFTTKFLGRGLGLSAVQGIMRAHRGGVRFDTTAGSGACVEAIFPVDKAPEQVHHRVA